MSRESPVNFQGHLNSSVSSSSAVSWICKRVDGLFIEVRTFNLFQSLSLISHQGLSSMSIGLGDQEISSSKFMPLLLLTGGASTYC